MKKALRFIRFHFGMFKRQPFLFLFVYLVRLPVLLPLMLLHMLLEPLEKLIDWLLMTLPGFKQSDYYPDY